MIDWMLTLRNKGEVVKLGFWLEELSGFGRYLGIPRQGRQ